MAHVIDPNDPRIDPLLGGARSWWDQDKQSFVPTATTYLPYGCPDWGERNGQRNNLCTFCALPNAVIQYRNAFYEGASVAPEEIVALFSASLKKILAASPHIHTLMIFNAGSFLAMPEEIQEDICSEVLKYSSIKRVVIESRAELIKAPIVERLANILELQRKSLTIRIGVETQDDHLRLKILRKGHSRKQLSLAADIMRDYGVRSGGYALLNPAPGLEAIQAIEEAKATLDWILGGGFGDLNMDEAYFCSTNVGPNTPLANTWKENNFRPASLWMVLKVLLYAANKYGPRAHLLPFKDEPELLAVPSNHISSGLPQNLKGATGCDLEFHQMLSRYRETMNPAILYIPDCQCRPPWFSL